MASNYETQKKMRAAQVGTIMPWVGDLSTQPDGWLECNGQTMGGVRNLSLVLCNAVSGQTAREYILLSHWEQREGKGTSCAPIRRWSV